LRCKSDISESDNTAALARVGTRDRTERTHPVAPHPTRWSGEALAAAHDREGPAAAEEQTARPPVSIRSRAEPFSTARGPAL
jgi:hypothetical protein